MKYHHIGIFILGLYLSQVTVMAQEFTLDAEYRPRFEVRSGYSKPMLKSASPDFLMQQRTRLGMKYASKWVNAGLTIQDSRVFGEANQQGKAVNSDTKSPDLFLYEAWAELMIPRGFSFKIGRQVLSYDDQRLLSKCNWSNTGSAHDVALLSYRNKSFKADLAYAYNNSQTNPLTSDYDYGNGFYRSMGFLWLSEKISEIGLNVSAIGVSESFQWHPTGEDSNSPGYRNYYKFTYGGNIAFKKEHIPLSVLATAYGQSGRTKNGVPVTAYLFALKADYHVFSPFTASLGADLYSGTSYSKKGRGTNTFIGLYGSNHAFNGAMDYWSPGSVPSGGLLDLYLTLQYSVKSNLDLTGSLHTFALQHEIYENSKKDLGRELDLSINYKFYKFVTLQAGWSAYFDTGLTKVVKGVTGSTVADKGTHTRFNQFAFVSLSIFPSFFTYKKEK